MTRTRNIVNDLVDKSSSDIEILNDSLNKAAINSEFNAQLKNVDDKDLSSALSGYSNLANFLIRTTDEYSNMNWEEVDSAGALVNATTLTEAVSNVIEWLSNEDNKELANALVNLNYDKYTNYDELVEDIDGLNESEYRDNFKGVF